MKFGRALLALGTGGASELAHAAIKGNNPERLPESQRNTIGADGQPIRSSAQIADESASKVKSIYGSEAQNLSGGVETYMSGLRGNLDKNVAEADIYNQQAGRERAIARAKGAVSGVDMSSSDEQLRRNSIYGAAGINEAAKRNANAAYGKATGNIISGVNRIEQQGKANAIASMPVPVAKENSGGLLDSLFGWI